MGTIRIFEPAAAVKETPRDNKGARQAAPLDTLQGKTLGLLSDGWKSWNTLLDRYEEIAARDFKTAKVVKKKHWRASGPAPKEMMDDLAKSDAAIVGLGN